jgi:hypothetical protein
MSVQIELWVFLVVVEVLNLLWAMCWMMRTWEDFGPTRLYKM